MSKKNLTDEQIYNLLLSQKLPFQKQEHFERFLKTASEKEVLSYVNDFDYLIGENQHLAFVRFASTDMIRAYLKSDVKTGCNFLSVALEIISRNDHEAIMLFIEKSRHGTMQAEIEVPIIKRNNQEEVTTLLSRYELSIEGKRALLEFDRLNNSHKIRRFYDYFSRLPEEVEVALVTEGAFNQIKHYYATKFNYNAYQGRYISIDSEKVLLALLKRGDMFEQLVTEAPYIKITQNVCLIKNASHKQLMLWLSRDNITLDKEAFSLLIGRKNIDELLVLKNRFKGVNISDSDISVILSYGSEALTSWLLETLSVVKFKTEHALQMLQNNCHYLFQELIKSDKNGLSASDMISVVIDAGNDEDMSCVINHQNYYCHKCDSLLISSGNQKWINMYRKRYNLPPIHV